MKLKKKLTGPRIYPLYSFLLTAVTFCIVLFTLDILGYGNRTLMRSDLIAQYVPFIQSFLRVLKGEESFWYSFSSFLGSGSILNYAYYTINPFNLLYLIDGISVFTMTTIIIVIKLGLASASFTFFAQKVLKSDAMASILFALCYALSTYSVTLHYHIMWLDALYLLPWIVWLIFRLIDTGKYFLLLFSYAYLFITNFYMAFIIGVFSVIIYLVYFLYFHNIKEKKNRKLFIAVSGKFALSVLLAAGLCAIVLLPTACFLFRHMAEDNFEFQTLRPTFLDLINTLFIGQMADLDNDLPFLYSGLLTLLVFPFYFSNHEISKKEKIFAAVPMLFLLLCMFSLPLYKFMHAFDYPNWYAYRFSFLLIFLMTAAACRQFSFLHKIEQPKLIKYAAALLILYSALIPLHSVIFGALATNSNTSLLINAAFIALWLVVFHIARKPRRCLPFLMVCLTVAELSVNAYMCNQNSQLPIGENTVNQWYYAQKEAIETIKQEDSGFYRIDVGQDLISNSAQMFDYAGFNTFSSSDDYPLRRALSHLGLASGNRFISNMCRTDLVDLLFSGKYIVTLPSADSLSANRITQDNYAQAEILENPYALSLGYMVTPNLLLYEPTNDSFINQENLITCMTGRAYNFYDAVLSEDITTAHNNIGVTSNNSNDVIFYHLTDKISGGISSISIPHREGQSSYFCFYQKSPGASDPTVQIICDRFGADEANLFSYGNIVKTNYMEDSGEDVIYIYSIDNTDYFCNGIFAYYYDDQLLKDLYLDLSAGNMNVLEERGDYIRAAVTATEERPLLFTSIPYDDFWYIYVDGILTPSMPVLEDAFLGVALAPGEHLIEFRYIEEGSNLGARITLISFGIVLLLILGYAVKRTVEDGRQKSSPNRVGGSD